VTEGYITDQQLTGPSRTVSVPTGNLFRASQDTVRDVFSDPAQRPFLSQKKRQARPGESLTDEEDADISMRLESVQEDPSQLNGVGSRPIRPLRRTRKLGVTQSSPAIMLSNSSGEPNQTVEEDWSIPTSSENLEQFSYDPMPL
jgi:hypothetical protein